MDNRFGGYELYDFIAEYYDTTYKDRRFKDIDFFTGYSKKSGGRTLELGCGTGRVLIPTAAAGCEITGLDLSPYMLQKCREKLNSQPPDVQKRARLLQSNMIGFNTGEKYSLITIPFRPFQLIVSTTDQKACLKCIHQHLEPQGLVIIDIFNPNPAYLVQESKFAAEQTDLQETSLSDGRKVRRTTRMTAFHPEQQYNDVELIYYVTHPDGRQEKLVQSLPMRYYYRYEMEHLLELCRFEVIDLYGNFNKTAFMADSPEMIFLARKK